MYAYDPRRGRGLLRAEGDLLRAHRADPGALGPRLPARRAPRRADRSRDRAARRRGGVARWAGSRSRSCGRCRSRPLRVEARIVRPGRSVELVEATLSDADGEVIRARAWRLRIAQSRSPPGCERRRARADRNLAVDASSRVRSAGARRGRPGRASRRPGSDVGYHTAMEYRFVQRRVRRPRSGGRLDADAPSARRRRGALAASAGAGRRRLGKRRQRRRSTGARYLFINVELTVHLHRALAGEWVCLDAITIPEPNGVGVADTALYDERGPIGRAVQALLDRRARGSMRGRGGPTEGAGRRGAAPGGHGAAGRRCEVVEGGLDVEPERLLELAPGAEAIVADPTVAVDDRAAGRGGAAARGGRQLRGRLRQRRSRSVSAPGRRGHQHAGRAHQRDGRARPGADGGRRAADERRGGRACGRGAGLGGTRAPSWAWSSAERRSASSGWAGSGAVTRSSSPRSRARSST